MCWDLDFSACVAACARANMPLVNLLLDLQSSVSIKDANGLTARDHALRCIGGAEHARAWMADFLQMPSVVTWTGVKYCANVSSVQRPLRQLQQGARILALLDANGALCGADARPSIHVWDTCQHPSDLCWVDEGAATLICTGCGLKLDEGAVGWPPTLRHLLCRTQESVNAQAMEELSRRVAHLALSHHSAPCQDAVCPTEPTASSAEQDDSIGVALVILQHAAFAAWLVPF